MGDLSDRRKGNMSDRQTRSADGPRVPHGVKLLLGRLWCRLKRKHVPFYDWGWTYDPTVRIGGGNAVPFRRMRPSVGRVCLRCGRELPTPFYYGAGGGMHTHL